jgi:hypothetical protein
MVSGFHRVEGYYRGFSREEQEFPKQTGLMSLCTRANHTIGSTWLYQGLAQSNSFAFLSFLRWST